jgi:hypothetical protein
MNGILISYYKYKSEFDCYAIQPIIMKFRKHCQGHGILKKKSILTKK